VEALSILPFAHC